MSLVANHAPGMQGRAAILSGRNPGISAPGEAALNRLEWSLPGGTAAQRSPPSLHASWRDRAACLLLVMGLSARQHHRGRHAAQSHRCERTFCGKSHAHRRAYTIQRMFETPVTGADGKFDEKKAKEFAATTLDVLKTVFFALLDIFKGPPEESTGKDSPGLVALGSGGVGAALTGSQVLSVQDGSSKDAGELCGSGPAAGTLLLFLTHFGDFNSWEVAQQVRTAIAEGRTGSARVALIGIGSLDAGREFVKQLELPNDIELYADATGTCHKALGFSTGALPEYKESLNPYFRVFLMLLGVGSPGTIRTVLGGYFGDASLSKERTSWVDAALKQGARQGRFPTSVPRRLPWEDKPQDGGPEWAELASAGSTVWDGRGFGESGLRPFELATVRLQNMVGGIIANWDKLKPSDDELLVQQGGAVALVGGEATYFYRDKGILTYVPLADALRALKL